MAGTVSSPFGNADEMSILNEVDDEQAPEIPDDNADDTGSDEVDSEEGVEDDGEPGEEDESDEESESEEDESSEEDDKHVGGFTTRPTYGQIKRDFPELFKKYPGLKDAFFREGQYTEIYPTVDDARDAAEQLAQYKDVEQTIVSGEPSAFMDLLTTYDNATAQKFAHKFLPSISASNPALFQELTRPFLKHVLQNINKRAGNNKDLSNSVLHIHNELFGDFEVEKPLARTTPTQAPKDENYEREKSEFYNRKATEFNAGFTETLGKKLNSHLTELVDPKGALSEYDRRNIIRDSLEKMDRLLQSDKQHMNIMGSLHARAKKSGFSPEYKDRIITAFLSRARTVLPGIVREVRSEALKARSKTIRSVNREDNSRVTNGSGRPKERSSRFQDDEIDYRSSSDLDILNDTPKLKKRK